MINAIVIDQVNYVNTGLTDDFLLNHKGAKYLSIWDTSITKIPASIVDLTELKTFNLSGCANLKELPDLSKFVQLKRLYLSGCDKL